MPGHRFLARSVLLLALPLAPALALGSGATAGPGAAGAHVVSRGAIFTLTASPRESNRTSEGGPYRIEGGAVSSALADAIFSDDFESGGLSAWASPYGMPGGTVAFFEASACPAGWTPLAAAGGRALVGRPAGGSIGGTQGAPLADLVPPAHSHLFTPGTVLLSESHHSHWWSILGSNLEWVSYSADYAVIPIYAWDNGIDAEGVGYYPFAAAPNTTFATSGLSHSHQATFGTFGTGLNGPGGSLPYLQLLACRKN